MVVDKIEQLTMELWLMKIGFDSMFDAMQMPRVSEDEIYQASLILAQKREELKRCKNER